MQAIRQLNQLWNWTKGNNEQHDQSHSNIVHVQYYCHELSKAGAKLSSSEGQPGTFTPNNPSKQRERSRTPGRIKAWTQTAVLTAFIQNNRTQEAGLTHLKHKIGGEAGLNTPADNWTQVRHMELIGVEIEGRTRQKKLKQQLGATRDPRNYTKARALLSTATMCSYSQRRSGIPPLLSPWTGWHFIDTLNS